MPGVADRGRRARRGLIAAAASVVALAVLGGAGAATITGTAGPDRLEGTPSADILSGLAGADQLDGLGGADFLDGGPGRDVLNGGPGDDRLAAEEDGAVDVLRCGAGRDTVTAELADQVAPDCETVSRRLSRDPFTGFDGQHETEVEPDSFAFGSTIVTVFQVGRSSEGGADVNGFATSRDAGRTWRTGLLPSLTLVSTPAGSFDRASDPVVGYDARHGFWLATSIVLSSAGTSVVVSRSRDGVVWGTLVTVAQAGPESPDKEWLVCDNWRSSRFRGSCYVAYYDLVQGLILVRSSRDGGATWSQPVAPPGAGGFLHSVVNGAQPVVRKNGALVVIFSVFGSLQAGVDQIDAVQSTDGGVTFAPARQLAALETQEVEGLRVPPFASAEVAGDGAVWVAWSDCRFRSDCDVNDIVLARSTDGLNWTRPVRVPSGNPALPIDYVLPGLAVDPASSGKRTRLGIVYHSVPRQGSCAFVACAGVDVGFVGSLDAGRTWSKPQRLTTQPMALSWIADGGIGALLGDYVSASWVGGRPIPVFSLASPPVGGELRQAIFAATQIYGFPQTK